MCGEMAGVLKGKGDWNTEESPPQLCLFRYVRAEYPLRLRVDAYKDIVLCDIDLFSHDPARAM